MIKWEYKLHKLSEPVDEIVDKPMDIVRETRTKVFNELGAEGWEMIKLDYGTDGIYTIWKRPI